MKNVKQIIKESIDGFGWVEDILDIPPTLSEYVNGDELKIGGIYNLKGKWSGYGGGFISLPEKGIVVEYVGIRHMSHIMFIVKKDFNVINLNYSEGDEIFLNIVDDAPYLFVTPIEGDNINESNDFDWVSDIQDTFGFYVRNNLLIPDKIYSITGNLYNYRTQKHDPIPNPVRVKYYPLGDDTNEWTFILLDPLFIDSNEWGVDDDLLLLPDDFNDLNFELVNENLNESDDWDWVSDIEEPTLKYYIENKLLNVGDVVKLTGYFYNGMLRNNIYFSEDGTTGVVEDNRNGYVYIKLLDEVRSSLFFDPGQLLMFDGDNSKHIMVEIIRGLVKENNDFDWINDIKMDLNWWHTEDNLIIGNRYKLFGSFHHGLYPFNDHVIYFPEKGIEVKLVRISVSGIKVIFWEKFSDLNGDRRWDYEKGDELNFYIEEDGDTLFIEEV